MTLPYDAVLFDLLSALVDSWSLWDELAGGRDAGRRWRMRYLEITYATGAYRDYESLVAEAAADTGLPPGLADELTGRWDDLRPWPEAPRVVSELADVVQVGVVTNCSETLGRRAAERIHAGFDCLVTAESAGVYKPDRRIYGGAIAQLGVEPRRTLYVAGSPLDVPGASAVGMPVYWHNRPGIDHAEASSGALTAQSRLDPLRAFVAG